MAIHKLAPRFVETVKNKGMHGDGGGLYLQVGPEGRAKSWIFRYHVDGCRDRQMGLGSAYTIGLAEAREKARQCREIRLDGGDPIELRDRARLDRRLEKAREVTFRQCAEEWLEANAVSWSAFYAQNNRRRFEAYAYPTLGKLPIQMLDTRDPHSKAVDLVYKVLHPIWTRKPKSAEVLQKGPLGMLLPKMKSFYRVKHYKALPYQEIGKFMGELRAVGEAAVAPIEPTYRPNCSTCNSPYAAEIADARAKGASIDKLAARFGINRNTMWDHVKHLGMPFRRNIVSWALELIILCAVRKDQVLSAKWDEIDLNGAMWRCSQHKTTKKVGGATYDVPLSSAAIAVLRAVLARQEANGIESKYMFQRDNSRGRLAQSAVNVFMNYQLGRRDVTIHGFRTSFASWAMDTNQDDVAREMALGHAIGNGVSRIYTRQADKIQLRREMMEAWAAYCDRTEPPTAGVIEAADKFRKNSGAPNE
jgi:integrase